MKLSGWQRLWIVFSVITLLLCGIFVYSTIPSANDIQHRDDFYKQLNEKYQKKIIKERTASDKSEYIEEADRRNLITRVRMPNNHVIIFLNDLTKEEMEKASQEYRSVIEREVRSKRINIIKYASIFWVVLVSMAYLLGWGIGWIYSGFKHK